MEMHYIFVRRYLDNKDYPQPSPPGISINAGCGGNERIVGGEKECQHLTS